MDRGYIKLWRKALDSGMLQNSELWAFWSWCLLKASHKPRKVMVGVQVVELQPGQLVFGRNKAAAELKVHESKIYRFLSKLQKLGNISVKSNNKYSVVTIINWHTYQDIEQPAEQQVNNKRTTSEHEQECNNERIYNSSSDEEESSPASAVDSPDSPPKDPCPHQKIIDLYHRCLPELPPIREWNDTNQANLRSRWREKRERQNLEWWERFFLTEIKPSAFLTGKVKSWQATLPWIVKPTNFSKILNGQYRNFGPRTGSTRGDNNARACAEFLQENQGGDQ